MARDAGARGGKIAGAGGGGFLLLYCEREHQDQVTEALRAQGLHRMDFRFESGGAMVIVNTLLRKARDCYWSLVERSRCRVLQPRTARGAPSPNCGKRCHIVRLHQT